EPVSRVDRDAVLPRLEVQVAARRGARRADVAQDVAPVDRTTRALKALQVQIARDQVDALDDAVVDGDDVATTGAVAPADDGPARRRADRSPAGRAVVQARMEPGVAEHWVHPPA